jgi:2,3-dihydroxybiphenyl 1,2-dioxygenase
MERDVTDDLLGLAYLVFEVKDLDAWHDLLVEALGMTPGTRTVDGALGFRADEKEARVLVRAGDADDLVAMAFEVADEGAMRRVAARAREAGHRVEEGPAGAARTRHARGLVRITEPSGLTIEIVHGLATASAPLDTTRCEHGFVTGDQGLGHVALRADDVDESRRFFEQVLGFRLTDRIRCELRGGYQVDVTFLHVNARHHTVALGSGLPKHLDHFMLQTRALDDLGRIYDRCFDRGVRVTKTLGRHPNDRMIGFYGRTPSGFQFECGYGGVEVDAASWTPATYDRISVWGHRPPGSNANVHMR